MHFLRVIEFFLVCPVSSRALCTEKHKKRSYFYDVMDFSPISHLHNTVNILHRLAWVGTRAPFSDENDDSIKGKATADNSAHSIVFIALSFYDLAKLRRASCVFLIPLRSPLSALCILFFHFYCLTAQFDALRSRHIIVVRFFLVLLSSTA